MSAYVSHWLENVSEAARADRLEKIKYASEDDNDLPLNAPSGNVAHAVIKADPYKTKTQIARISYRANQDYYFATPLSKHKRRGPKLPDNHRRFNDKDRNIELASQQQSNNNVAKEELVAKMKSGQRPQQQQICTSTFNSLNISSKFAGNKQHTQVPHQSKERRYIRTEAKNMVEQKKLIKERLEALRLKTKQIINAHGRKKKSRKTHRSEKKHMNENVPTTSAALVTPAQTKAYKMVAKAAKNQKKQEKQKVVGVENATDIRRINANPNEGQADVNAVTVPVAAEPVVVRRMKQRIKDGQEHEEVAIKSVSIQKRNQSESNGTEKTESVAIYVRNQFEDTIKDKKILLKQQQLLNSHTKSVATSPLPIEKIEIINQDKSLPEETLHSEPTGTKSMPSKQSRATETAAVAPNVEKSDAATQMDGSLLTELRDQNAINAIVHNLQQLLQPCNMQIYPYNFISAVRHKLAAISDELLPINAAQSSNQHTLRWQSEGDNVVSRRSHDLLDDKISQQLNYELSFSPSGSKRTENEVARVPYQPTGINKYIEASKQLMAQNVNAADAGAKMELQLPAPVANKSFCEVGHNDSSATGKSSSLLAKMNVALAELMLTNNKIADMSPTNPLPNEKKKRIADSKSSHQQNLPKVVGSAAEEKVDNANLQSLLEMMDLLKRSLNVSKQVGEDEEAKTNKF